MKFTIDTLTKTVSVEQISVNELNKIKKSLEAIGEKADEYKVVSQSSPYYVYPTYPAYPTWPSVYFGDTAVQAQADAFTLTTN